MNQEKFAAYFFFALIPFCIIIMAIDDDGSIEGALISVALVGGMGYYSLQKGNKKEKEEQEWEKIKKERGGTFE